MKNMRGACRLHPPLAPTRTRVRSINPATQAKWTAAEDKRLVELVAGAHEPNWTVIAMQFPGKTLHQVVDRWDKVVNPSLVKGSWTREEDEIIMNWVKTHGATSWTKLAEILPGRIGKQCRERWHNGLNPELVKTTWLPQEDQIIETLQRQWGNKWARIAELLPGRTDNAVKNRWNSTLKRRAHKDGEQAPAQVPASITVQLPTTAPVCIPVPAIGVVSPPLSMQGLESFELDTWKDAVGLFDMTPKLDMEADYHILANMSMEI